MKMHHTPIEATNPFAEAANGGQTLPGQGGVTGGGEAHEAWHRAVEQAGLDIEDGVIADGIEVQTDVLPVAPIVGMGDQERTDEISVSWDRLSMTVASMVAWNMQVEMVEESPAGEMSLGTDPAQITSVDPNSVLMGDGGEDTIGADAALGSGLALALSKAISETNTSFQNDGSTKTGPAVDVVENLVSSTAIATETVLPAAAGDPGLVTLAENSPQMSSVGAVSKDTTTDQNQNAPDMFSIPSEKNVAGDVMGIELAATTEAPMTAQTVAALDGKTTPTVAESVSVKTASVAQSAADAAVLDQESPTPEIKTTADAPKAIKSPTKSVDTGLERLAGIRAAIAELDAHVAKSSQVTASNDPSAELKGRLAELDMTYRVSRDVIHNTNTSVEKSVPMQPIDNGALKAPKPTQTSGDEGMALDGDDLDSPVAKRTPSLTRNLAKPEMASGIHRPGRMGQSAGTNSEMNGQMSFSESSASITGNENSEISADVDRTIEFAEFDAANIEAGEVPELPIGDLSQLDIDIEDPAGNVRLAMTKEAEEVVVRLETPEEVVEEYREMEEEIGKQIAKQGLDLTDFSADAHGDQNEDGESSLISENESNQNAQTDVEKGEQTLEETGDSARLINRIV